MKWHLRRVRGIWTATRGKDFLFLGTELLDAIQVLKELQELGL